MVAFLLYSVGITLGTVVVPPHAPDVWGGAAYGPTLGDSSHLFAFSGADGATSEGTGFTGLLMHQKYGVQFGVSKAVFATLLLDLSPVEQGNGTLVVASSDVVVVNGTSSGRQEIVLAYQAWNVLVGYAPSAELSQSADDSIVSSTSSLAGGSPSATAACNITGAWYKGRFAGGDDTGVEHSSSPPPYTFVESGSGAFVATTTEGTWHSASGQMNPDGTISITFHLTDGTTFADHGTVNAECSIVTWKNHPGEYHRVAPPRPPRPAPPSPAPPAPAGCTLSGRSMAICKNGNLFAIAFGTGTAAASLAASALTTHAASKDAVDSIASMRLAPLGLLPPPAMVGVDSDFQKLNAKVFSVMRVNTLAPEGTCATHWSTPDKAPHQAMWLWDSCFHAIGRQVVEPELAWEFLHAMLTNAADDGHVPIQAEPWNGGKSGDTQPPLLALATKFAYNAGGVNNSQLAWALPKLERYIQWDFANRDVDNNGLLNWHQGTESGLDNSPLWDAPHATALHMGATEFSAYAALEMSYLSEFHTILGNASGAAYWAHRSNVTTQAIHDLMWDEDDQFYYYYSAFTKTFVKVMTPCGFAPLLLPGVSDDRVAALVKHINDPKKFASKNPIPTVAMDYVTDACPASSTNMWRRPTWTNTNLFTIWGLRKYGHVPGALEAAAKLQQATVEMVGKEYEAWGVVFEFYDSNGVVPPPFLERKGSKDGGGVRDYHWTAANTFYLLHSPNASLP